MGLDRNSFPLRFSLVLGFDVTNRSSGEVVLYQMKRISYYPFQADPVKSYFFFELALVAFFTSFLANLEIVFTLFLLPSFYNILNLGPLTYFLITSSNSFTLSSNSFQLVLGTSQT